MTAGAWRATAESQDLGTIGFHIPALYSPVGWMSWEDIARLWEAAATDEAKRSFKNSVLGETWVETGEAPDWQRLYERRESWQIGTVPGGGLFLTAGADVQKDRIEVDVWAWGRGLGSWLIDHIVIDGGPEQAETWNGLARLLDRTWLRAHGTRLGIAKLAIDTGYEAPAVYAWSRKVGHAQVAPIKGVEGFNRAAPVVGPTHVDVTEGDKKLRRGARLWTIAVATFKSETYRFLRLPPPTDEEITAGAKYPTSYVHLPRGAEAEWVKQLVAEQLVTVKTKRGFSRLEWQKLRERNEALDCRVYARAAAWMAGADRWARRPLLQNLKRHCAGRMLIEGRALKIAGSPRSLSPDKFRSISAHAKQRPMKRLKIGSETGLASSSQSIKVAGSGIGARFFSSVSRDSGHPEVAFAH